jgi:hypothetical protein
MAIVGNQPHEGKVGYLRMRPCSAALTPPKPVEPPLRYSRELAVLGVLKE